MDFERREAPYLAPAANVSGVMQQVLLALVPAALAHVWFFGPGLIFNLLVAAAACTGGEALMMRLRGRPPIRALSDYSALVTAALLAFALPSLTPWWVTATAALFAIIVAKHLYGGLGFNIFNPALIGRAFLVATYPVAMTTAFALKTTKSPSLQLSPTAPVTAPSWVRSFVIITLPSTGICLFFISSCRTSMIALPT